MNINQRTIDALYELVNQCFQMNRFCDSLVSVLGVKFAMNQTADKIHKNGICHYFPSLSDSIGDACLERYNIIVKYGATKEELSDYDSVMEMIEKLEERLIEFQNMYMGTMKISFENNDLHIYSELSNFIEELNKIVGQSILLKDKIGYYGEDRIMDFDNNIDKFWNL